MTEDQAKVVNNQEAGAPEAKAEAVVSQETQEPKLGSKEYNFRALENEKRELERRLQEREQFISNALKSNQPQQQKEAVLPELSPDDIPEWKHVTSYVEQIAEKKAQELLAKKEKERLPEIVKQKYQDFDQVVTADRVKQLETENPALAQAFSLSSDPYTAVYSYLKAIHATKKQDPVAIEEAEKLLQNSNKPVSSNAVGRSGGVLKNANAFAKKSKEQLYREMMSAASRVN